VYGPTVYGASPETDSLSNQFAAMPSLHFGWALMVAIGLIAATRSRWRWLWLLHPLVTLLVVVGTANHYWLDAVVAAALLGIALAVIRVPRRTAAPAAPARERVGAGNSVADGLGAPDGPGGPEAPGAQDAPDAPELVGAGR
jgi:MFS superfamily sulfate permease-like transporter